MDERYNSAFATSAARGALMRLGLAEELGELQYKKLSLITEEEGDRITDLARAHGIRLHYFKRSNGTLPRVARVLGFLKGIHFESILDVGSGRGVFLLPFLDAFPDIPAQALDISDKRIELLTDIKCGGIERLSVKKGSICDMPFPEDSFDVVTMLEVLEHIPDVRAAIRAAVRIAKKYVIVTVPSKEDDNPEHIHLLTKDVLTEMFTECGAHSLHFDGVHGHLIMIGKIGG